GLCFTDRTRTYCASQLTAAAIASAARASNAQPRASPVGVTPAVLHLVHLTSVFRRLPVVVDGAGWVPACGAVKEPGGHRRQRSRRGPGRARPAASSAPPPGAAPRRVVRQGGG